MAADNFHATYGQYRAIEEVRSEIEINWLRFTAIVVLYINTSINYFFRGVVSTELHVGVSVIAVLSIITVCWTYLFTRNRKSIPPWFKYVIVLLDVAMLSGCIVVLGNSGSALRAAYFLIISFSALRFSPVVAVFSGITSTLSYHLLVFTLPAGPQTPDLTNLIILTLCMLLLAFVIAIATWRAHKLVYDVTHAVVDYNHAKGALARYVSNQVADEILRKKSAGLMEGKRRDISVLMSDIRGFTTMSDKLEPEKVVEILNIYFSAMIEIIFRNNGTLDKFIGDAIMVIFGAPIDNIPHAELAVKTAVEMQAAMDDINRTLAEKGLPPVYMGIGLSSGPAVVGDIGSSVRMEYTAIGKTVNLAQRLESKAGGGDILASETVICSVTHNVRVEPLEPLAVKGFTEKVNAYRVLSYSPDEPSGDLTDICAVRKAEEN